MAIIFSDNFNSYTDGDLVGQGSWSSVGVAGPPGFNSWDVQGTVVFEGAKAVSCPNTVNSNGNPFRAFTGISTGNPIVSVRGRNSVTNAHGMYFGVMDSANKGWFLRMNNNATLTLFDSDFVNSAAAGSYAANTWHLFEIEVDVVGKRARSRVDGGAFSSYVSFTTFNGTLERVFPNQGTNESGTHYLDSIVVDDMAVAATGNFFAFF